MKQSIAVKLDRLTQRLAELDRLLSSEDATRDLDLYRNTIEHTENMSAAA